jgi:hypothetical protein
MANVMTNAVYAPRIGSLTFITHTTPDGTVDVAGFNAITSINQLVLSAPISIVVSWATGAFGGGALTSLSQFVLMVTNHRFNNDIMIDMQSCDII